VCSPVRTAGRRPMLFTKSRDVAPAPSRDGSRMCHFQVSQGFRASRLGPARQCDGQSAPSSSSAAAPLGLWLVSGWPAISTCSCPHIELWATFLLVHQIDERQKTWTTRTKQRRGFWRSWSSRKRTWSSYRAGCWKSYCGPGSRSRVGLCCKSTSYHRPQKGVATAGQVWDCERQKAHGQERSNREWFGDAGAESAD
jgi:hypothetical protein